MKHASPSTNYAARTVRRRYFFVHAVTWFATVLPMPVHVLLANQREFGLQEIGWMMGCYALTVALLEVPTGGLADTYGRKRIALAAIATHALAAATLLVAFELPVLFAHAVLLGVARALGSGALVAWFVDALLDAGAEAELQPSLALAGTVELIALAAGTLVGGALPTAFAHLPSGDGLVWTPLATPVAAAMAMHATAFAAVAFSIREPSPARTRGAGAASGRGPAALLRDARALVRTRPVLPLLLAVQAVAGFALLGLETFWQPFLEARLDGALGRTWIFGVVLAGSFLAGMIGNLVAIPLARWSGGRRAHLAAAAVGVQVAALAGLATSGSAAVATGFFWLAYFAIGLAASPLATLFHRAVPAERRSSMLSVQSLLGFAGSFAGSLVLGLVAEGVSIGAAWAVAAAVLTVGVGFLMRAVRSERVDDATEPASA